MVRLPRWPAPLPLLAHVGSTLALALLLPLLHGVASGGSVAEVGGVLLALVAGRHGAFAAALLAVAALVGVRLARRLEAAVAMQASFGAAWLACLLGFMLAEPAKASLVGAWLGGAFLILLYGLPGLLWAAWAPVRYAQERATGGARA